MFSLFSSNPTKSLKNKRKKLLANAVQVQRSGDLRAYAVLMEKVDELDKEIEANEENGK